VCTSPALAGPVGAAAGGGGAAAAGAGAGEVLVPVATAAMKRRADSECVVTLLRVIIEVVTSSSL
jgi:hypothetical protein